MCGLVAVVTTDGRGTDLQAVLGPALTDTRHRGPDEEGSWADADAALGFRRLSIIDVESSHQPLTWGPDDRYHLVFNGEIYNYRELRERLVAEFGTRFGTDGDGEAIVAGYHHLGPAVVDELRGMFAFVIWDAQERVAFAARDPFGIKPLFTATTAAGTFFASEEKALLDLTAPGPAVDRRALQHYFTLQYVPEPETLHPRVRRVPSGSTVTVAPGSAPTTRRYARLDFAPRPVGSSERLYREIAEALEDSVDAHLRSDVTVGSFLSGGIDSTAIAALARRRNPDLVTFTAGFERQGYSEVDEAAASARALGVEHVVTTVSAQDMMDVLPLVVWYLDEPVADPALVPLYFVAREARKRVKVVLSGEGADELFGGYTIYHEAISLAPFDRVPRPLRRGLGRASSLIPEGVRGKDLLRRGAMPLEERYFGNARIFRQNEMGWFRGFDPTVGHADVTSEHYASNRHLDGPTRMQHIDLFTWLRGDILVKADKMTMANSLELRVPFLDRRVFEVAATIPVDEKLSHGTTKYALRRALADIVPPEVMNRPKLGWPVPIRLWLEDEMYDWACDIVSSSGAGDLVDKEAVLQMIEAHRAGPHDLSRRIWTILVFLLWHGIFVEERIRVDVPEPQYPVLL